MKSAYPFLRNLLFLLLVWPLFFSCKMFLGATGNYKEPKKETAETIKENMGIGRNYDGLFILPNDISLKHFLDSIGNSVPAVFIFNKQGQNIYQDKSCVWSNINQLDSLKSSAGWVIKEDLNIEKINKSITLIDGRKPDKEYDFVIYYVWAKYIPKLSLKMLETMEKDFRTRTANVYIGSINLDFQKQ